MREWCIPKAPSSCCLGTLLSFIDALLMFFFVVVFFKKATQTLKMHELLLFLFLVPELCPQKTDKNHKIK